MPCIFNILSFSCKSKTGDPKSLHKTQKRISKKNYFREIFRKSEYSTGKTEVKTDDSNIKMPLEELRMVIANKKICIPTYKNIPEKGEVDSTAHKIVQNEQIIHNFQIQTDSSKVELSKTDTLFNESSKKVFSHKLLLNLFRKRKRIYEEPICQNTFKHTDKHCDSPISSAKFPIVDVIINKNPSQKSPNISSHLNSKPQTPLSTFKRPKPLHKPPNLPHRQLSSELLREDKPQHLDNTYEMPLYQEPQPSTKSKYHLYDNNEATYNEEHYDLPWDLTAKHSLQPIVTSCPIPTHLSKPPLTGVDERPCAEYNEPWSQLLPLDVLITNGKTFTPKAPKYLALPQPNTCYKHKLPPKLDVEKVDSSARRSSIHSKIKLFESQLSSNHEDSSTISSKQNTNSLACRRRTCLNVRSDINGGPLSLSIHPAKVGRASPSFKKQASIMTRSLDQGAMADLL